MKFFLLVFGIRLEAIKFKNENGRKAKVSCMGLAFKLDIDDLRASSVLSIAQRLIVDGLDILAAEPNTKEFKILNIKINLDYCGDIK